MDCFDTIVFQSIQPIVIRTHPQGIVFVLIYRGDTTWADKIPTKRFMADVIELIGIVSYQKNPFLKKPEPQVPGIIPQNGMNFCFWKIERRGIDLNIFQVVSFVV